MLNLSHMNCDILVNLYTCYARPILEYSSVVFSPHNLYLIDALEHVQRNFTKDCLVCMTLNIMIDYVYVNLKHGSCEDCILI